MGLKDQLKAKGQNLVKSKDTPEYHVENEQETTRYQRQEPLIQNEQELLMRLRAVEGYLSTVLQEVVQKEMTFQQEIENLVQISKDIEEVTHLIMKNSTESLNNRSKELEQHTSNINGQLQALIETYSSQLKQNQQTLHEQLKTMQSTHLEQLKDSHQLISDQLRQTSAKASSSIIAQQSELKQILENNTQNIETEMSSLKSRHEQQLNEISKNLSNKISSVRWKIIKTEWLDAAKQGLMTAIFLVPIYLLFRFVASLINIDLP